MKNRYIFINSFFCFIDKNSFNEPSVIQEVSSIAFIRIVLLLVLGLF